MNVIKLIGLASLGLATLTACGGGTDISGTYDGTVTCDTLEFDTELTLAEDEDDKALFTGELTVTIPVGVQNPQDPNTPIIIEGDFIALVEATVDPKEDAQDVDADVELDRVENCTRDGEALDDCTSIEGILTDAALRSSVEFSEFEYDGENTLTIDENDCEGDLERPAP